MLLSYTLSATGVIVRVKVRQDNTGAKPGQGYTGLAFNTAGLIVSTIADVEAAPVTYTVAGVTIATITTLGTYVAPTHNQCNLKKVDDTNNPGIVELHFINARFAVANAKYLIISLTGVTGMADCDAIIPLTTVNPYSAAFGLSLAKTTNITGFNDILATSIVTGGAITTTGGAVSNVTTTATATNLTNAGPDTVGTTTLLTRVTAAVALASQIPANFTSGLFASAGVFSTGSFANLVFPTVPTAAQNATATATAVWQDLLSGSDFTTTGSVGAFMATLSGNQDAADTITPSATITAATSTTSFAVAFRLAQTVTGLQGKLARFGAEMAEPSQAIVQTAVQTSDNKHFTITLATAVGAIPSINQTVYFDPPLATALLGATAPAGWINTAAFASGATLPICTTVTNPVTITLSQTGLSPRALDAVADAALTVGDALVCAVAGAAGKQIVLGTAYTVKTPSTATTIRTFTLDTTVNPTSRT